MKVLWVLDYSTEYQYSCIGKKIKVYYLYIQACVERVSQIPYIYLGRIRMLVGIYIYVHGSANFDPWKIFVQLQSTQYISMIKTNKAVMPRFVK